MPHALTVDMRDRIIALLDGEISLPEFQDWLVGATWDVETLGDREASDLTYDVKLALAELSRGDISSTEFRARLRDAIRTTTGSYRLG
jgi:hypothetical protein